MRSQSVTYWLETEEPLVSIEESIQELNWLEAEAAEIAEIEALWGEEDDTLEEWLRTHGPEDESYSDIFKDVYGFRPRF